MGCVTCDGACQTTCSGGCYGCVSCTGACNSSCTGNCGGSCSGSCTTTCTGSCINWCGDCTGSCIGNCTGSCTGGCTTTCGSGCTGGCTGCTSCSSCSGGCSACTGSCTGYCDSACTAVNTAQTIAAIGNNIAVRGLIKSTDFVNLKTSIRSEFTRRSKTLPTNDTYTVQPANGVVMTVEHLQKPLTDEHTFSSSVNYTITSGNIAKTTDAVPAVTTLQTWMNQNIRV